MMQEHLVQNACDCHMHIFDSRFPASASTALNIPEATVDDYRKIQNDLGTTRCVVVQPSGYGLDNSCLLDALKQLGSCARGVAVVQDSVSDNVLSALNRAGVRGARFNLVQAGATTPSMLAPLSGRIARFGWHVQVHCTIDMLVEIAPVLNSLPVPVVFDHIGRLANDQAAKHPGKNVLLDMLERGRTWVKLSAPYLNGWSPGRACADLRLFVKELVRQAPERLVWGSDWPHVTESVHWNDRELFDLLEHWSGGGRTWRRILQENPQRLYGFD